MKKLFCLLLAVGLALGALCAPGTAEDVDKHAQGLMREAVGMCAQMTAGAVNGEFSPEQKQTAIDFARMAYASPLKAVVADLPAEKLDALAASLGTNAAGVARALGRQINTPFSRRYAETADALCYEDNDSAANSCAVVLLVYENDLTLSFFQKDGSRQSVLLMGAKWLPEKVDDAYIAENAAALGLSDVPYTFLATREEIVALLGGDTFFGHGSPLTLTAILSSDAAFERMLPEAISCGNYGQNGDAEYLAEEYLKDRQETPEQALAAARFLSERIDPIASRAYGANWLFANSTCYRSGTILGGELPPFSFDSEGECPKDGTVLVVWDAQYPDEESTFFYHMKAESALPPERIPESPAAADLILLMTTRWTESEKQLSDKVTLYDSNTVVTLHDAKTGAQRTELGTVTNTPSGFITVFSDKHPLPVRFDEVMDLVRENLL